MIPAETKGRLPGRLRGVVRRVASAGSVTLGIAVSVAWAVPGWAVGLGPVVAQSELGRPLRIVIPVLLSPGEDIAAECFKLATVDRDGDGVPQQLFGRVSLERTPAGPQLVITNARPVNDPALRVTVQAGCDNAVRREYVLLMDPSPIEAPLVAAESVAPTEVAIAAPPPVLPAARPAARMTAREGAGAAPRASADTARPAKPPAPQRSAPAARPAPKRQARINDAPRLTISSAPGSAAATKQSATEAEQIRAQQELSNAIEAETVVLRQRIVELTAMVDRMQQEVRASEAAQRAAEETAKPAPPPKAIPWWEGPWWTTNWPLLAALIVLPVLLAAGLLWRRRTQGDERADWQAAGGAAIRAEPVVEDVDPTVAAHPVAAVAPVTLVDPQPPPRKAVRRTPPARDGANALAVSELLQVTEEARVYVALGHPERAIDVLNEHIRQVPRSMPAAWLMLLDLYHASGRRQDFRRHAEEFHLHCNVQAPLWEGFRAGEVDEGGLDTFPHILRQVVEMWRQPQCREYLEGLLYDNREGRRMGFPLAAYSDILLLMQILDAPPVIDIDSDLARTGMLDPTPRRAGAAASDAEPRDRATKPFR